MGRASFQFPGFSADTNVFKHFHVKKKKKLRMPSILPSIAHFISLLGKVLNQGWPTFSGEELVLSLQNHRVIFNLNPGLNSFILLVGQPQSREVGELV